MNEYEAEDFLEKEISNKIQSVLFITVGGAEYETNDNLARAIVNKYKDGLWLSLYYPSEILIQRIGFSKQQTENITFIDGISKERNCTLPKNAIGFDKTASLSEISLAITKALDSGKHQHFFFSESLGSVFYENTPQAIKQFTQYLLSKLKNHEISLTAISLKGRSNETSIQAIRTLFNKEIPIKD